MISKKAVSVGGISLCILVVSHFYVNCGGGFKAVQMDGLSSIVEQAEQASEQLPKEILSGKVLYNQNCSGCHSMFETSAKKGRTAEEITTALKVIPQMQSLKIDPADIQAIAEALKVTVTPGGPPPAKFVCVEPNNRGLSDKKMRRLTRPEIVNTLSDLMSPNVMSDSQIQTQLGLIPRDILDVGENDIAPDHASTHALAMFKITLRAADLVAENATLREKVFGSCSSQTTVSDTCAQTFIRDFGLKVYRRPLIATESTQLFNQFKTTGGIEGLKRTLVRLLLSPSMTFHMETNGTLQGTRIRLTDYEVASRLSYRLTGTMPDDALLAAAANGSLQKLEGVKTQAQRLIANHPAAKARIQDFFRFYLQSDKIPDPYIGAAQLNGLDSSGLRAEMGQELNDFINNVVWTKNGSFKDLMTSVEVFPRSDRMAKILETNPITGNTPAMTSTAHAGLILRPAMLAASEKLTKPFHRAAVVRKRMLCDTFGAPDAALVEARQKELGDLSNLGNRERLTAVTNIDKCLSCHTRLNPVAFTLEGYDQLGMRRSMETVFDAANKPLKTFAINTQVEQPFLQDDKGDVKTLQDGVHLNEVLSKGPTAGSCFAQSVFEFQRARSLSIDDFCALAEIEKTVASGGSVLDAFLNSIVNEDIFWKAKGN